MSSVLLGLLVASVLLPGCSVTPEQQDAIRKAWAARDAERAAECAQKGYQYAAGGCLRGGGP